MLTWNVQISLLVLHAVVSIFISFVFIVGIPSRLFYSIFMQKQKVILAVILGCI